jgi:hypothetical protein
VPRNGHAGAITRPFQGEITVTLAQSGTSTRDGPS